MYSLWRSVCYSENLNRLVYSSLFWYTYTLKPCIASSIASNLVLNFSLGDVGLSFGKWNLTYGSRDWSRIFSDLSLDAWCNLDSVRSLPAASLPRFLISLSSSSETLCPAPRFFSSAFLVGDGLADVFSGAGLLLWDSLVGERELSLLYSVLVTFFDLGAGNRCPTLHANCSSSFILLSK